jgi:hypothetical protein
VQGRKLRHGFCAADPCTFLVAQVFDLPLDQVERIDAPLRLAVGVRVPYNDRGGGGHAL